MGGGVGSTWEDNLFLHGHAEWVETRDLILLIHVLELKLQPFEVTPYSCNIFRPRATWEAGPRAHINVTTITHFGCIGCLLGNKQTTHWP